MFHAGGECEACNPLRYHAMFNLNPLKKSLKKSRKKSLKKSLKKVAKSRFSFAKKVAKKSLK